MDIISDEELKAHFENMDEIDGYALAEKEMWRARAGEKALAKENVSLRELLCLWQDKYPDAVINVPLGKCVGLEFYKEITPAVEQVDSDQDPRYKAGFNCSGTMDRVDQVIADEIFGKKDQD